MSQLETRFENGVLSTVVHNIGSRPAPASRLVLTDAAGKTRAERRLPPIPAPTDLQPKRVAVQLTDLPGSVRGWNLRVDPDDRIPEIYEGNNSCGL